ncbi:MAG: nucleotide exchange factor GrpE [Candidatus Limnocylindria bacterium]
MTDQPTNGGPRARGTKTRGEERAEAIKAPTRIELAERIELLERELEEARRSDAEHQNNWHRSAADFANFKRRTDEERATLTQFSNAVLIGKLLGVLDDFDRALENVPPDASDAWIAGVQLTERKLRGVLEAEGVTAIEAVGETFDPNLHEAVVHEETADHPDNQVIGELQRGYRLHDRIIRPSLVRVANNPKEH